MRYRFERLPENGFHLVYSAGLYDYIRPSTDAGNAAAQALTRFLFDLVAPGGELVIGNFNPSLSAWNRFSMDFLCNWQLGCRNDVEMLRLADSIDVHQIEELGIVKEDEGINSFLVLRKNQ